ncbi:MAG: hypothetical protein ACLQU1_40450 [Bryobacteraceae bacterium]
MPTKLEARVAEHDRQIAAIRKLILQGMKMINSLAASQRKTDAQLQAFIQSLAAGPQRSRQAALISCLQPPH